MMKFDKEMNCISWKEIDYFYPATGMKLLAKASHL